MTFAVGLSTSLSMVVVGLSHDQAVPVQVYPNNGNTITAAQQRVVTAALRSQPDTRRFVAEADDTATIPGLARGLVEGLDQVAAAAIAWGRIEHFWRAASRREPIGQPGWATCRSPAASWADRGRILLDARDLVFRYPGRGESALREVNVQVHVGDRLLLRAHPGAANPRWPGCSPGVERPKRGCCSWMASTGPRSGPTAGGAGLSLAPQFHENHVLMGPFAFNALMGRA